LVHRASSRPQREWFCFEFRDSDFYHTHLLRGESWKLLFVRIGNIRVRELKQLFQRRLPAIEAALSETRSLNCIARLNVWLLNLGSLVHLLSFLNSEFESYRLVVNLAFEPGFLGELAPGCGIERLVYAYETAWQRPASFERFPRPLDEQYFEFAVIKAEDPQGVHTDCTKARAHLQSLIHNPLDHASAKSPYTPDSWARNGRRRGG